MSKALVRIKKREFSSYNDWKEEIKRHQEEYNNLMHKLTSIGGSGFSDMPMGNFDSDIPMEDTYTIQRLIDIEEKIEEYERKIKCVDDFLRNCDEEVAYAVKEIYINGKSFGSIGLRLCRSESGLSYIIEEEIKRYYC